jgi:hypothetical protein
MKSLETKNIHFVEVKETINGTYFDFVLTYTFKKYYFSIYFYESFESVVFRMSFKNTIPIQSLPIFENLHRKLSADLPNHPHFRLKAIVLNMNLQFEKPWEINSIISSKIEDSFLTLFPSMLFISFYITFLVSFVFIFLGFLFNVFIQKFFPGLSQYNLYLIIAFILLFIPMVYFSLFFTSKPFNYIYEFFYNKTENFRYHRLAKKYPYFMKK